MNYKKKLGVVLIKSNDMFIIQDKQDFFEVNEIAARILDMCNGKRSVDQIIEALSNHFEASGNELDSYVNEFLAELVELNLIKEQ